MKKYCKFCKKKTEIIKNGSGILRCSKCGEKNEK